MKLLKLLIAAIMFVPVYTQTISAGTGTPKIDDFIGRWAGTLNCLHYNSSGSKKIAWEIVMNLSEITRGNETAYGEITWSTELERQQLSQNGRVDVKLALTRNRPSKSYPASVSMYGFGTIAGLVRSFNATAQKLGHLSAKTSDCNLDLSKS